MLKSAVIRQKTEDFFEELLKNKIVLQAVLVGLLAGVVVVLFKLAVDGVFFLLHSLLAELSVFDRLLMFPLITSAGGLISGLLVFKLAPETRGSGIPYIKMVLNRIGRVIRLRSIFVKFAAGVAGIGAGLPLGREGPSVQIGAGVGSWVGQLCK